MLKFHTWIERWNSRASPRQISSQTQVLTARVASQMYLRSPRPYYEKVRKLKNNVYKYSALALSLRSTEARKSFPCPEAVDSQILDWRQELVDSRVEAEIRVVLLL